MKAKCDRFLIYLQAEAQSDHVPTPEEVRVLAAQRPTLEEVIADLQRQFSGEQDASKTFLGVGLVPSDRDRMRQWDEFATGTVGSPDQRLSDGDETRGLIFFPLVLSFMKCAQVG